MTRHFCMRGGAVFAGVVWLALAPHVVPAQSAARGASQNALQNVSRFDFSAPQWTSLESFSELASLRELSSGAVLVADPQEVKVVLIDKTGQRSVPIGQKGSGPAEYRFPTRLLAYRGDTTMLLDRDAQKYLLIDGQGKILESRTFPPLLGMGSEYIRATDNSGRLYFRGPHPAGKTPAENTVPIMRWKPGAQTLDTVTMLSLESPPFRALPTKMVPKEMRDFVAGANVRFAAVDDWAVSLSGRIAMIHAAPYRVDWVESNRTVTRGVALSYKPVPVTDADKKRYEPKGPPFVRSYAPVKSPFIPDYAVIDADDNVWLPRYEAAASPVRRWDVFDRSGKHVTSISLPASRTVIAVTAGSAYVSRVDSDGLYWLERYARK